MKKNAVAAVILIGVCGVASMSPVVAAAEQSNVKVEMNQSGTAPAAVPQPGRIAVPAAAPEVAPDIAPFLFILFFSFYII